MFSSLIPTKGQIDTRLFCNFEDEDTQILESPFDIWTVKMCFGYATYAFNVNLRGND
jgi:hypothetical protein